jgi:hypothetical protein
MRHIGLAILFLIIIDYFWKKQNFKFSYGVIRYLILGKWALALLLLPFNWGETATFVNRATGPYWWAFSIMLVCGFILPILLLHKKLGRNKWMLLVIGFLSTFGITFEIFVILLTNLHQDYLSTSSVSFLSYIFFRPLIMASLLVGIDLIIQKFRKDKEELLNKDVLDQE